MTPSLCTFRVLHRVTAHSLSAVEAEHFDGAQTQHLGVLTNSIDLISDPFQGHNLALFETGRGRNEFKIGTKGSAIQSPALELWKS